MIRIHQIFPVSVTVTPPSKQVSYITYLNCKCITRFNSNYPAILHARRYSANNVWTCWKMLLLERYSTQGIEFPPFPISTANGNPHSFFKHSHQKGNSQLYSDLYP